jgi:hypothetical protein
MRQLLIPFLLALILGAVTCDEAPSEPDPSLALRSLRWSVYDPSHGLEYWTRSLDRRSDTGEWDQAVAYCAETEPARHPNCRTIELLALASRIPGFRRDEVLP